MFMLAANTNLLTETTSRTSRGTRDSEQPRTIHNSTCKLREKRSAIIFALFIQIEAIFGLLHGVCPTKRRHLLAHNSLQRAINIKKMLSVTYKCGGGLLDDINNIKWQGQGQRRHFTDCKARCQNENKKRRKGQKV